MNRQHHRRVTFLGLFVVSLIGCNRDYYTPPPENIPPPEEVAGTKIVIEDARPDWERKPFTGQISLYHLGKATPNPWTGLAEEAKKFVATLSEKPDRLEIHVSSFRLVRRGGVARRSMSTSENVRTGNNAMPSTKSQDGSSAAPGAAGNNKVESDPGQVATNWLPWSSPAPESALDEHPIGASASLEAKVKLIFPGGREKLIEVKLITAGSSESGNKYWGDALDTASKEIVRRFGYQLDQTYRGAPPG